MLLHRRWSMHCDPGGSHSSPGSSTPSPHTGSLQVQSSVHVPPSPHIEPGGSHSSGGVTISSPQNRSHGKTSLPVTRSKLRLSWSHDGRGCTSQSCASQ